MWSSAAVAHVQQDVSRDALLNKLAVTSGYLSYCCLSISSRVSGQSHLKSI